jgi:hypothetical protein
VLFPVPPSDHPSRSSFILGFEFRVRASCLPASFSVPRNPWLDATVCVLRPMDDVMPFEWTRLELAGAASEGRS